MNIFDGRRESKALTKKITDSIKNAPPPGTLLIVQIGENKVSKKYVALKKRFCEGLGLSVEILSLKESTSLEILKTQIEQKVLSTSVQSALIQLPLPSLEHRVLLDLLPLEKDIDLLSRASQEMFYSGDFSRLSPVVRAFEHFLVRSRLKEKKLNVLIIGGGFLVGKPIAHYLLKHGSCVDITENYSPSEACGKNLVVSSTGRANLVNAKDLDEGCSVVDFGASYTNNLLLGDINLSHSDHLNWVSPSPGGMGPLVVRYLVLNHLGI